jgi:ribosomal peptide maturation radical SAM protein 1
VSAAVSGEGDIAFPELVTRVLRGDSPAGIAGVYVAGDPRPEDVTMCPPRAPVSTRLDELPVPDYDDYFAQLEASGFPTWADPAVLFETARGCWWGQSKHCNYCSLNGREIAFRSKSPGRLLEEVTHLAGKYPGRHLQAVDNMLDMSYFRTVFPELARLRLQSTLFFEVPCRLSKTQIRILRDAGVTRIQPGIESLSTPILRLMNRPATQLSNVQLLKWCQEFNVLAVWNLLFGIPSEPPQEYERGAELLPKLTHLFPPVYFGPFSMSRYSPYFEDARDHGLTSVRPYASYEHIFPFDEAGLTHIAHYYSYDYAEPQDVTTYTASMGQAWKEWYDVHYESDLFFVDRGDNLAFMDLRPIADQTFTVLSGLDRTLYLACDGASKMGRLVAVAEQELGRTVSEVEIEKRLTPWLESSLMIHEEDSYLALALPVGDYEPRLVDRKRLDAYLRTRDGHPS